MLHRYDAHPLRVTGHCAPLKGWALLQRPLKGVGLGPKAFQHFKGGGVLLRQGGGQGLWSGMASFGTVYFELQLGAFHLL